VVDYHQMEKGCVLKDSTIAEKIGTSTRTAERRLKELREAGYLRAVHGANRRQLVPELPDKFDGEADTDVGTPDTHDVATDTHDGEATDTDVVHRDIDISANAGESAPTREGSGLDSLHTTEGVFEALVDVWRSVSGAPPLSRKREDALWGWAEDRTVANPDLFRDVLEEQAADTAGRGVGMSMGILLKEYKKRRDAGKLRPDRQDDPDWTIDEQGRKCYMGVPIEETGPQNLAEDLPEPDGTPKDGARSPEPEVSPHG